MSLKDESQQTFYYPCCPIIDCQGVLWIKYINENFSIDYECEKNKDHKGFNIYFETFDKYYIKEINKCIKCKSRDKIRKCKICLNIYCSSCSLLDEHIKQDENNCFFIYNEGECKTHGNPNKYFCIDCNTYICNECECLDDRENGHNTRYILDLVPSKKKMDEMINRLGYFDKLINKIDSSFDFFNEDFIKKTERLKKKMLSEKNLIKKIILNYDNSFINYTYHLNFEELYKYTKSFNNEYIEGLYLSNSIQERSKFLIDSVFPPKKAQTMEIISTYLINAFDNTIIKLNEDTFLNYISDYKKLQLIKYNDKKDNFEEVKETELIVKEKIGNISCEKYSEQIFKIYACLCYSYEILIYECDLSKNLLFKIEDEIFPQNDDKIKINEPFKKCIELSKNGYIATITSDSFYIWEKKNANSKEFLIFKFFEDLDNIEDIISIDDNYFIVIFTSEIKFYNKKTFDNDKNIKIDEDYSGELKKVYVFDKCLIVICEKKMAFILINTKEIIQFYEYENTCFRCISLCFDNDKIYSLYEMKKDEYSKSEFKIVEYKMNFGSLEKVKCYVPLESEIFLKDIDDLKITCLQSKKILFIGNKTYKMSISKPREFIKDIRRSHITISGKCVLKKKW